MKTLASMDTATRWIFFGNLLCSLGLLSISVGSTYRMAAEGNLPTGRPAFEPDKNTVKETNSAKDYFS